MALPRIGSSRLLEHLHRIGMKQKDFAKQLKVSNSFVSRVISGERHFSLERAKQAATILRCKTDDLHHWIE
ncbi:XRE family transcriptional regulator [Paenibacillaceae bacterium]|nr:XRE family transcriptional regulator [Paenibacillaceae bacterium]